MIRFILFGLAVAAATVAAMMYLTARSAPEVPVGSSTPELEQKVQESQVLVARQSLPARHRIESGDIGWTAWPQDHVQPFFTVDSGDPALVTNLEGRYTSRAYGIGEPLDIDALEDQRVERLSDRVSQGMRAVAVSVSAQSTAGGFVKVDDYVDIIRVAEAPSASPGSSVILENVRVLAVGSSMGGMDAQMETVGVDPGTVTLELTPQQATILAAADFEGRLALALRARADHAPIDVEMAIKPSYSVPEVLTEPLPTPVRKPEEKTRHSIGVLQGEEWVPYEVP